MNNNSTTIGDGLNYIEDGIEVEQCKLVFKLIFEAMHQEQHYKMMMGLEEENLEEN
jgi:hypothetical protein